MIHAAARFVSTRLHERGFPVSVRYQGNQIGARGTDSMSLHFYPDTQRGNQIGAPPSAGRAHGNRGLSMAEGGLCIIAASSSHPGATAAEHESLCKQVLLAAVCAICDFAVSSGFSFPTFGEARFLDEGEIVTENARGPRGNDAVFVLRFSAAGAIVDATFDGELPPMGNPIDSVADPTVVISDEGVS